MLVIMVCLPWKESVNVKEASSGSLERHYSHNYHGDVCTHKWGNIVIMSIQKHLLRKTKQLVNNWNRLSSNNGWLPQRKLKVAEFLAFCFSTISKSESNLKILSTWLNKAIKGSTVIYFLHMFIQTIFNIFYNKVNWIMLSALWKLGPDQL